MAIRVVAHGGVDVRGVSVNGGEHQVNKDGNVVNIEAVPQDNIRLSTDRGDVDVPAISQESAQRGWRRLDTSGGLLAYGVDDDKIVVFPQPNLDEWMSSLPDDRALADVTIPGTHESASIYGGFISQCQTGDVAEQLRHGIRFFDIRLKLQDGELKTYHGIQAQNSTLQQQVDWINDHLRQHPRETVVCSIKQEAEDEQEFPQKVYDVLNASGMWHFDENFPTLGNVRGKGVFFSRFSKKRDEEFPNGQGLKPLTWTNNDHAGFEVDWHGTNFRIHDWYDTDDIPSKVQAVSQFLEPTCQPRGGGTGNNHPYSIVFMSGGKFPQAPPQWFASGGEAGGMSKLIGGAATFLGNLTGGGGGGGGDTGPQGGANSRLVRWILQKAADNQRPRATLMLDFYRATGGGEAGMAELLAAVNYINE